jgi:hypothetical protein
LWREALLAQAVLRGDTKGYRKHPQLTRFRRQDDPRGAISAYLLGVYAESVERGYTFDLSRIDDPAAIICISETEGQLLWEWGHLRAKLRTRAPELWDSFADLEVPQPHPMFLITAGPIQEWERAAGLPGKRMPPTSGGVT